jgi:hypothetical protein
LETHPVRAAGSTAFDREAIDPGEPGEFVRFARMIACGASKKESIT